MSDAPNPDQIARLVANAEREQAAKQRAAARRPRRVRELDFSRPMKLNPVEQRRFESAHVGFCRDLSVRLSSELREPIELEVQNLSQLTWTAAVREVPQPSILAILSTLPLETSILIAVEEPVLLGMIERLLGGGVLETPKSRTLTEIDMALARRIFGTLIEALSAAWSELLGLRLSLVDVAPQHSSVDLVPPSEPTVALTIQARDGGETPSTISLLVPYSSIAPVAARLSGMSPALEGAIDHGGDTSDAMRTAIGAVDVELRAEVGSIELTMNEILALGEGDLIRLGPVGEEALYGGDERLHRARPGLSGNRRAAQIIERIGGEC
jgi:flagellar motor switch protein FliM